ATLLLGLVGLVRRSLRLPRRDLAVMAGLSLLSPVGYFLFETYGVAYTQPSHVSVIIATIPLAVYIIAYARKQEMLTWKRSLGTLIAYAGVVIVVLGGAQEEGATLLGDLLVLGAVLCAAVRTTLIKDALRRVSPLQLTFYQFFFALFVFAPLSVTDGFGWFSEQTAFTVLAVLFLGVFCSAGAFLFMHYALVHLSATQVAVSANLVPVITLIAEIGLLGASVTLPKLLGIGVTLAGVLLTQIDRSEQTPPRMDYESAVIKPTGG
ncbi:MAG TPA: EamA family transporter, partial [Candidatus Acetothermia bacterium]|nr:EamA family transporter [Candidatus Acetothermia bacterium]